MMEAPAIDTEDNLQVIFDDAAIDDLMLAADLNVAVAKHADAVRAADLLAEMNAAKVLLELLGRLRKPARAVILQNRDRGTPAMIAQMNQIASGPDYYRVAPTKEFASGTPIVFGNDNILPTGAVIGRKDKAVAANGQRFPVRYAVVEAADLLTSNKADGTAIDDYAGGAHGKLRAIAGNGRLAGLVASFDRGTAADYVRELAEDDAHGIAQDAIAKFKQPVLVRIMNQEDVTENIGDISNQRGTSDLSPVEQAQNDSKRLDLTELDIADDGKPSEAAALAFIAAMPESERNNLMDGKNPSQKAYDRLMATVFWKAYGDAELVRLYAQSVDPEVKTILGGMASASGDLAKLAGAGELDIRSVITEAAGLAVNAKRQGVKLSLFAQQSDMTLSPDTMDVVKMFAENSRSAKKIGERLRAVARFAFEEFTKEDQDMFGAVEKASRAQVLAHLVAPVDAPEVSLFDAIDPLLELELSGKLVAKTAALAEAGEDDPMAVVTISGEIIAIIQQLQDADVPDTPESEPMESEKFRVLNDPAFKRLTGDFTRSLAVIVGIDNGTERGYDRALFVNSIVGKIKTQAKNDPALAALLLAWLSVAQSKFAKPAITERNGVWAVVPDWKQYLPLFGGVAPEPVAAPAPVRSEQFQSYRKAIEEGSSSIGMMEQIRIDERLKDGEAEILLAMVPQAAPVPAAADPVAGMLAQAVADPVAHEAWTLPQQEIEMMPKADFDTIMAKLVSENFHSEALIMRAARIGTLAQYDEAADIRNEQLKAGYLTPELGARAAALAVALDGPAPAQAAELANIPSAELKAAVLREAFTYSGKSIEPISDMKYLAAKVKASGRGIFVVDGTFDRATFKAIIAEGREAGLDTSKIIVFGRLGTYSGQGIDFTLLSEYPALQSDPAPAPAPQPTPQDDVSMQNLISIAADSIDKLRRIDVYRVLNSAHNQREALATYIIESRPDLQREVLDVMAEEWPDLGYSAPAAPSAPVVQSASGDIPLSQPLAETQEVPPVPEAEAAPAANPQRDADMAFLQSVISQSLDMWDDDLADKIEKLGEVYAGDADVEKAWGDAIKSYTDFMVEAMSKP